MYLFTRSRRIEPGEFTGAMEWTVGITETVRRITGKQVDAWGAVMSPEMGTIVWTLWAESLTEIEAAGDKLAADSEYVKAIERGSDLFEGPVVDGLGSLVHGAPNLEGDPPNYAAVVTATSVNGRLRDAIGGAIEIATAADRISGQPTMVCVNATGPYGGLAWITPTPDLATLEAGESALMADPSWLELIDRVGTAYAPGATQTIYRRIV